MFSRTIKDLVCRFQAMQGKSVTRIAGWDTHGRIVEWTRSVFRGDRFRFVARRRLTDDLPAVAGSR